MTLQKKIRALPGEWLGPRAKSGEGYYVHRDLAATLAASHDALMAQMVEALFAFVDCREESRCIDDCVPEASERAWKSLVERMQKAENAARAALRAHKEQQ